MILFFPIFSKIFFFTAFLSMNIKTVSKGNETKTCVKKSFDIIITEYTLNVCGGIGFDGGWTKS